MGSNHGNINKPPLVLNEFKTIYWVLRRGWPDWAAFLLLGFLVWVEGKTVKARVKNTVSDAIEEYVKETGDPTPVVSPPVYSETGTDFFDEMRLTAPWLDRKHPSDSP